MSFILAQVLVAGLAPTAQATDKKGGVTFRSAFGCFFARVENKRPIGKPIFLNILFPRKLADVRQNDAGKIGIYDPNRIMDGLVSGFDRIQAGTDKGAYFFCGSIKPSDSSPVLKVSGGRASNRGTDVGVTMEYDAALLSHGQLYQGLCSYIENEQIADDLDHQRFWRDGDNIQ